MRVLLVAAGTLIGAAASSGCTRCTCDDGSCLASEASAPGSLDCGTGHAPDPLSPEDPLLFRGLGCATDAVDAGTPFRYQVSRSLVDCADNRIFFGLGDGGTLLISYYAGPNCFSQAHTERCASLAADDSWGLRCEGPTPVQTHCSVVNHGP